MKLLKWIVPCLFIIVTMLSLQSLKTEQQQVSREDSLDYSFNQGDVLFVPAKN